MVSRARYALALAMAVASVALGACGKPEKTEAVAATEPSPTVVDAPVAETANATCAESDIECEERIYQLEETLFAYEAAVTKLVPESAQTCWKSDSDAFRQKVDGCRSFACKETALLTRIAGLHSLQPEAQRAALELPQSGVSNFDPSQCHWIRQLPRATE